MIFKDGYTRSSTPSPIGWCGEAYIRTSLPRVVSPLPFWLSSTVEWPGSAEVYGIDHVRTAGLLVLLGGAHDIFDGRVARLSGLQSKFGAFYDSVLDRISEVAIYIGLISLYNQYEMSLLNIGMIYMIALAMAGSLIISYSRARAETLGLDCSVGLMQRAERIVLLGVGSLIFGLSWDGLVLSGIIVIFAVLTNTTAIHRIIWVHRQAAGVPLDE